MSTDRLAASKAPGGAHHLLAGLAGRWQGVARTWFKPDELADESLMRAEIRLALDGRFVVLEYEGSFGGEPLAGLAILGHHLDAQRFTMAWIDSFHTGTATMYCEGETGAGRVSVTGHYDAPEGPPWGWRTELEPRGDDELVLTAYNIPPGGTEARALEIVYTRVGV